jgi:hypothetical protein
MVNYLLYVYIPIFVFSVFHYIALLMTSAFKAKLLFNKDILLSYLINY